MTPAGHSLFLRDLGEGEGFEGRVWDVLLPAVDEGGAGEPVQKPLALPHFCRVICHAVEGLRVRIATLPHRRRELSTLISVHRSGFRVRGLEFGVCGERFGARA